MYYELCSIVEFVDALQTLSSIGNEKNTTVIFPVPIDILSHLIRTGDRMSKNSSVVAQRTKSRPEAVRRRKFPDDEEGSPVQGDGLVPPSCPPA